MKFSLFYPILKKIWPYEMPYFWVKKHLKPCLLKNYWDNLVFCNVASLARVRRQEVVN